MSQIELRTALNAPLLPPDGAGEGRGAAGIERARVIWPGPPIPAGKASGAGWGAGFVKVSWGRGPGCPKPSASTCREGERWRFPAGVWRA